MVGYPTEHIEFRHPGTIIIVAPGLGDGDV